MDQQQPMSGVNVITQTGDAVVDQTATKLSDGVSPLNRISSVGIEVPLRTLGKRHREEHDSVGDRETSEREIQHSGQRPPPVAAPRRIAESPEDARVSCNGRVLNSVKQHGQNVDSTDVHLTRKGTVRRSGGVSTSSNASKKAVVSPKRSRSMASGGVAHAECMIRRYPQFCEAMGMCAETLEGVHPKDRTPTWMLQFYENVLHALRKAEAETAAGGVRAERNARRAAAGETNTIPWVDICDLRNTRKVSMMVELAHENSILSRYPFLCTELIDRITWQVCQASQKRHPAVFRLVAISTSLLKLILHCHTESRQTVTQFRASVDRIFVSRDRRFKYSKYTS